MGRAGSVLTGLAAGLTTALAAPVLGAIGGGFAAITEGVIGTNAAMQQSKVSWGVLLGGAEQAEQKLADLFAFGASTPFEFGEVDSAARLLQTFGGSALNTMDTLTMVGDAAAAGGRSFQEVAFWTGRMYDAVKNGQPFGEAAMNLQQMGLMSGDVRGKMEELSKSGASSEQVWATFTGSMSRFGGMMEQQSQTFNGRLSTMKDTINQLLATAGKPIFQGISDGLGMLNQALSSPAVIQFATALAQAVAGGLSQFFGAVGAVLSVVGPLVATIMGDVVPAFTSMGDTGSGVGAAIADALATLKPIWDQLAATFQANLPAIAQLFRQAQEAVEPLAPVISLLAQAVGAGLVLAIQEAATVIGIFMQLLGGALPGIIQAVSGLIQVLGGTIQVLASIVQGTVGIVSALLAGDWAGAWTAAQDMVAGVAEGVGSILDGLARYVTGLFTALFGAVDSLTGGWASRTASSVTNLASGVGSSVQNMSNGVQSTFQGLSDTALGHIQRLADQGLAGFRTLASQAGDAVRGLRDSISSTLSGLAAAAVGWARSIGEGIVRGIVNGIRAGLGWVRDAARNLAQSAVDAAKDALGIHSPSRVFADFGQNTVAGFIQGIERSAGQAAGAVGGLLSFGASGSLPGPGASVPASAVAGAGRGAAPIYVTIPNAVLLGRDQDVARQIAQLIQPELDRLVRGRY